MKKLILFSLIIISFSKSNAQELAQDQNPNYKVSMNKYMGLKDSLIETMNTTVQNTYAAPDWYDRRIQRRTDRRNFRRQMRLANAQNPFNNNWNRNNQLFWNNRWNNNWNNGWNNNWNNGFNNWNNGFNNWGCNNNACVNIGGFWFCF